jgi:hypothetical protein
MTKVADVQAALTAAWSGVENLERAGVPEKLAVQRPIEAALSALGGLSDAPLAPEESAEGETPAETPEAALAPEAEPVEASTSRKRAAKNGGGA